MQTIDLAALRKNAGLTQEELAVRLSSSGEEISQAQISRYEAEPDKVPLGLLVRWLAALGTSLADATSNVLQDNSGKIDPGQPYFSLDRNLNLLLEYIAAAAPSDGQPAGALTIESFRKLVEILRRKPNLVLAGKFDVGKSHLANSILGGHYLPTAYQPSTKVVTYVRHLLDRPEWFKEEVWIMKKGFDPQLWNDRTHCEQYRLVAGTLETLKGYGTHSGRYASSSDEAYSAVVYIDAPVLHACNLVDLPGYDDTESDAEKAESVRPLINILIYASSANGFLSGEDFIRLSGLLWSLPYYEQLDLGFPTLGNLFLVATHSSPSIKNDELSKIGSRAAVRLFNHIDDSILLERRRVTGRTIDPLVIEKQIFTYWFELPERRKALETALLSLLSTQLPTVRRIQVSRQILDFKERATGYCAQQIQHYERVVRELDKIENEYAELLRQEPTRRERVAQKRADFERKIEAYRKESITALTREYDNLVNEDSIEQIIRDRYNDKREAQQYAADYIVARLQHRVNECCTTLSERVKEDIEEYLKIYNQVFATLPGWGVGGPVETPFDIRGAFLSGLAGAAAVGALALWAASLGNLGGYIIAAQVVSMLSAFGISIAGGTATATTILAAIGGPITIAIGIGVFLALTTWAIFSEAWERRLANKLVKVFQQKNLREKFSDALNTFWDGTRDAFRKGADEVEKQFQDYLKQLQEFISNPDTSHAELEERIVRAKEACDFFASIPWWAKLDRGN